MAARQLFQETAELRESESIPAVFDAVARRQATHGVVPIENSTEGAVSYTLDRLLEGDASINAEVVLPIDHCLLSHAPNLAAVQRVLSHPQPLAQCREWLRSHLPGRDLIPWAATSRAAREVADKPESAAISSALASELYGVPILRAHIQDQEGNATRFVVLSASDAAPTGRDKTSIAFGTPDERGALLRALRVFDDEGINLSRIESRPRPGQLWQYVFFVDLEGHRLDDNVARALARLEGARELLKVFGSYARAPRSSA